MKRKDFKLHQKWPYWPLIVSGLLLNGTLWALTVTLFDRSNPVAVLHYSVDVGIDFVGEGIKILTLPLIGSIVLFLNGSMGLMLYRSEAHIAWVLWSIIPLVQLVLLGSFLLLLRLNTISDVVSYSF